VAAVRPAPRNPLGVDASSPPLRALGVRCCLSALPAAVLAHGIAEGQPFLDGNKRLALVAMLTFLEINGYRVDATHPEQRFLIQPER
jgi:hypothetical protein